MRTEAPQKAVEEDVDQKEFMRKLAAEKAEKIKREEVRLLAVFHRNSQALSEAYPAGFLDGKTRIGNNIPKTTFKYALSLPPQYRA